MLANTYINHLQKNTNYSKKTPNSNSNNWGVDISKLGTIEKLHIRSMIIITISFSFSGLFGQSDFDKLKGLVKNDSPIPNRYISQFFDLDTTKKRISYSVDTEVLEQLDVAGFFVCGLRHNMYGTSLIRKIYVFTETGELVDSYELCNSLQQQHAAMSESRFCEGKILPNNILETHYWTKSVPDKYKDKKRSSQISQEYIEKGIHQFKLLDEMELATEEYIYSTIDKKGEIVQMNNADTTIIYRICPKSSMKILENDDVKGLNKIDLMYARNEIFADYGYIFTNEELKEYFGSKEWYNGTIKEIDSVLSKLNDIERINIEYLYECENNY